MKKKFEKICGNSNLIGASAVTLKDGKIEKSLVYGMQNREEKIKTSKWTTYRIASISKVVVAVCLMKLYEEGKIDIDEDISKYLGFKLRNPSYTNIVIKVKDLMTQTSSITDGTFEAGYDYINGTNTECRLEDLLLTDGKYYDEITFDKNKPGSKFIYSNFNCGILACVIEKITGKLFTEFAKEVVFKPLGMDASFVIGDIYHKDDIASIYLGKKLNRNKDDFIKKQYPKFPIGTNFRGPAGGVFANMTDLSRFMNIFLNDGYPILKKDTVDLMLSYHWQGIGSGSYRAKGLQVMILDYKGHKLIGHFGDAYGVRSFMLFNPERKIGICYITNGGDYQTHDIGIDNVQEQVLDLFIENYWKDEDAKA